MSEKKKMKLKKSVKKNKFKENFHILLSFGVLI